jgi:hypothetical protein
LQGEAAAWARFAAARDSADLWGAWLSILCHQIGRVGGGLLLVGPDAEGAFTPAGVWPRPTLDMQYLSSAAEHTLNERRGIVVSADGASNVAPDQRAYVGYPIEVSGTLRGAVVLDVAPSPESGLQRAAARLVEMGPLTSWPPRSSAIFGIASPTRSRSFARMRASTATAIAARSGICCRTQNRLASSDSPRRRGSSSP